MTEQCQVPRSAGAIDYFLANTIALNQDFMSRADVTGLAAGAGVATTLLIKDALASQPISTKTGQTSPPHSLTPETYTIDSTAGAVAGLALYAVIITIAVKRLGRQTYQDLRTPGPKS